jgi:hypothetical protein
VDARLHQLQGKTELVTDTLPLLQEFYREKLTMLLQHQAGACLIQQYDANNTYQYIVNRDDVQLSWVAKAIEELGGAVVEQTEHNRSSSGKASESARRVIDEDVREAQAFVDRWRPRIESMNHARHRGMLRVILGETLEQKRFFAQALAGRTDLLGRRGKSVGLSHGVVLPSRWIE